MTLNATVNENVCTIAAVGEIDTLTAPQLEQAIADNAAGCDKVVLDMSGVTYISSAGLRVVIAVHRDMEKKGGLSVKGLNENVRGVFKMTGFDRVLHIED